MAQNVSMQLLLEIRQFRQAWEKATTAAKTGARKIVQNTQRSGRAMEKAGKQAKGFAGAMDFLKKRVLGAGLFFAGFYQALITLRQVIGDAVRELFDLDEALRRVQSITSQSDASIHRLRGELFDLARQGKLFNQSASEVAESMFTIVQAGFDAADALTLARVAAEGAAVGFTTAETSAKVLVGTLKAYDLPVTKAREVMDVLFQAVDVGIVTFEDLASGLGKVLASAAALDVPLTEVTGAIATMTLRGFTADQAMTSLGRIMQTFIRPSQRAQKAAAEFGIVLDANTISSQGLIATMQQMFIATGGNVNEFAKLFDRIQSTRGAISLFSDEGVLLEAVMLEMGLATEGAGRTAEALEHVSKSLNHRLGVLRSQILAVTADALQPLMGALNRVVEEFSKILAGQNALFNYFANMDSLVKALVITFIALKAVALQSMFLSLAASLQTVGFFMQSAAGRVILMKTAMAGLSTVTKVLAPMLIFLAAFALMKFGKRLSFAADTADMAQRALKELSERLRIIDEQGLAKGLDADAIALLKTAELVRVLTGSVDDYTRALYVAGGDRGVESLIDFGVWANTAGQFFEDVSLGFLNWGKDLDEVNDDFANFILDAIAASGEGADGIQGIVSELGNLAQASDDPKMAAMLRAGRDAASELLSFVQPLAGTIESAKRETVLFDDAMISGETSVSKIEEGIKLWMAPLKEAKEAMELILGLTSTQSVYLDAIIGPLTLKIAKRNVKIADTKKLIGDRETELKDLGIDIDETEDGILLTLRDELTEFEDLNEAAKLVIDKAETRLTLEEETEKELVRTKLQTVELGKALDEDIIMALAEIMLLSKEDIPDALGLWMVGFQNAGGKLDSEVVDKVLDLIEDVEGMEMRINVETALTKLGFIGDTIASLKMQFNLGELSPSALRFGAAILSGQDVGMAASGVRNFGGGMAWVGEAGPELLRLPRGSDVIPNNMIGQTMRQTKSGGGGVSVSAEVNITTGMMREYEDLKRRVIQEVEEKLDDAAAEAGLAKPRLGTLGSGIPRV